MIEVLQNGSTPSTAFLFSITVSNLQRVEAWMPGHSERERASKDKVNRKISTTTNYDCSSYELYIQSVICISRPLPRVTNRRSNRKTSLVTETVDNERTKLSRKKISVGRI